MLYAGRWRGSVPVDGTQPPTLHRPYREHVGGVGRQQSGESEVVLSPGRNKGRQATGRIDGELLKLHLYYKSHGSN